MINCYPEKYTHVKTLLDHRVRSIVIAGIIVAAVKTQM